MMSYNEIKLHTNETGDTPLASVTGDGVQIEIRPSSVALCERRLGLGDIDAGKLELHSCFGRRGKPRLRTPLIQESNWLF